jgi:transposase
MIISIGGSVSDTPLRIIFKSKIHSLRTIFISSVKKKKMTKKKMELDIINSNCAGIDVGSRFHFVAVGQKDEDVKKFGVYAADLVSICSWLKEQQITSVAMESTGNYWQNLYRELIRFGFKVVLANGKHTKDAKGKKTDVKDSRWIQKLHTLGLLTGSFLPDEKTEIFRTYCRHRLGMIEQKADSIHKMQKYLKQLNFRLDVVVRDIAGLTGLSIIKSICEGILDPVALAKQRHYNCRKSEEEISKALHSNEREDFIFGLKHEYERHQFYEKKISECDLKIKEFLEKNITKLDQEVESKPHKRVNKNSIDTVDLNKMAFHYFGGIDLYAIPGVSHSTVLTIMSEIGNNGFQSFACVKQFTSWLRLAPNNKVSGGKMLSNRIPQGSNRLKIALRNAANAVGNMKDTPLSKFFAKIAYKKGRQSAVTATARKLAVIIYHMVKNKKPYESKEEYLFLDQKRKQLVNMRKAISKYGIDPNELGIFSRPEYEENYKKKMTDNQNII